MTKHTKWKVAVGKNGSAALRLGNTLIMPTWNTRDGAVMDSTDIVGRIAAALNFTDGIPLDLMQGVETLQEKLIGMVEQIDYYNDITYAEDDYPEWLFDLCGGIDKFDIARKDSDDDDEEVEDELTEQSS